MKIFNGHAVNFTLVEEDDGLKAAAEVVFIFSEARWLIDAAGDIVRQSDVSSYRLMFSAKSLRAMIKGLGKYADEMEDLERRASIEQPPSEK
jgi:hypothetical protein